MKAIDLVTAKTRRVMASAGVVLFLIKPMASQAAITCADFTDFVEGGNAPALSAEVFRPSTATPPEPICGRSLALSGAASVYCSWSFPYRSDVASGVFEQLQRELTQCFTAESAAKDDAVVNHPDSYVLRTFQTQTGRISLSIKDKGGLNRTLVFLRGEKLGKP